MEIIKGIGAIVLAFANMFLTMLCIMLGWNWFIYGDMSLVEISLKQSFLIYLFICAIAGVSEASINVNDLRSKLSLKEDIFRTQAVKFVGTGVVLFILYIVNLFI